MEEGSFNKNANFVIPQLDSHYHTHWHRSLSLQCFHPQRCSKVNIGRNNFSNYHRHIITIIYNKYCILITIIIIICLCKLQIGYQSHSWKGHCNDSISLLFKESFLLLYRLINSSLNVFNPWVYVLNILIFFPADQHLHIICNFNCHYSWISFLFTCPFKFEFIKFVVFWVQVLRTYNFPRIKWNIYIYITLKQLSSWQLGFCSNESEYWEQQKNPTNSIQFSTCGNNKSKFRTTYIILADELLLAGVDGLMMSSVKLTGLDEW